MTDQVPELLPQVCLPRWWLEQLRDQLFAMKKLPTGYVGDWVFMFREQLIDALESCPTPSERPVAHNVGGFVADYSRLTPEEIAQSEPELDKLYAHSVPAERPVAQVREALEIAQEIEFAISSEGKATLYELTAPRVCKILRAFAAERPSESAVAPEGWKLVPCRPTQAQMGAGLYQSSADSEYGDVWSIYVDMIAVAPSLDDPDKPAPAPSRSIPHGDAVRAQTIEECAKIADAQSDWADRMIEGHSADPSHFGTIGNTANDIAESIRALSRVQATSVASATACDHLTTEKADWVIEQIGKNGPKIYNNSDDGAAVCQFFDKYGSPFTNAQANAAFILDAVRHYRALIANQENLLGSEPEPTLASERVSEREKAPK